MGRIELSDRDKWQDDAAVGGQRAETAFAVAIQRAIEGSVDLVADSKPSDLAGMYGWRSSGRKHGIKPDYAIRRRSTGRTMYVEIKRQQAKGNAHERACKYWAPGILASMRAEGRQPPDVIPCWWVFTNGIANDGDYRQAIRHWFRGYEGHVLLWENISDHDTLIRHFDRHIRPLLG